MLRTSRLHVSPAGKAPQRGADAVKASYPAYAPLVALRARTSSCSAACMVSIIAWPYANGASIRRRGSIAPTGVAGLLTLRH